MEKWWIMQGITGLLIENLKYSWHVNFHDWHKNINNGMVNQEFAVIAAFAAEKHDYF